MLDSTLGADDWRVSITARDSPTTFQGALGTAADTRPPAVGGYRTLTGSLRAGPGSSTSSRSPIPIRA